MIKRFRTNPCEAGLAALLALCTQQVALAEPGSAPLVIDYQDSLLHVYADRVPVRDVAQALVDKTGVTVSLVGPDALADQCVSIRVRGKRLEKALAEVFADFSTAVYPLAGGSMPTVSVFLTRLDYASTQALVDDAPESPLNASDRAPRANEVPRDLDDYMPFPEPASLPSRDATLADMIDFDSKAELDAAEKFNDEQRLERAISATTSPFSHIRRMAVNDLAGSRSPRATFVLADIAASEDAPAEERAGAAEALWRHAGDFEFRDAEANDALRALADDDDASVSGIAKDALRDMERYLQRSR